MDVRPLGLVILGVLSACMPASDLYDFDGDGRVGEVEDCDPADPEVYWEGEEEARADTREREAGPNGKNEDCDKEIDEPFDADQDRAYAEPDGDDCDDDDPEVHPGTKEIERNGADDNCDGEGTAWDKEIALARSETDAGLVLALEPDGTSSTFSNSAFGAASAVLGDLGGDDGLDDLAIGAPETAEGYGAICLRLTRTDTSEVSSTELTCPIQGQENQLVGRNVSAGYVDEGDLRLLVGVQGVQGEPHNVWLLEDFWVGDSTYTRVAMSPLDALADVGVTSASMVDQSPTFVGDLSDDATEEFFVGASGVFDERAVAGLLYLAGDDPSRFRLVLRDAATGSVRSAARRGDIDGDGIGDLFIGLPSSAAIGDETTEAEEESATDETGTGSESSQAGVVYLIRGDDLLNDADVTDLPIDLDFPALTISGDDGWALGTSLESGSDLDGDGLDDLLVGARDAQNDWGVAGGAVVAYVGLTGGGAIAARDGNVFFNPGDAVRAGTTVALPGDTDADGQEDALTGSSPPSDGEGGGEGPIAWLLLDPAAPGVHTLMASETVTTFTAPYSSAWRVAPAGDADVAPGDGSPTNGKEFLLGSSTGATALLFWGRGM